ncbi:eukaryotic translation initiation factor 3 subunit E [Thecamonas trahens ATCC 50062]|uniref:Eukaryotic translation initiation factor 3 subunit E n=1 Tax=Thecamonas trahens ATCC 50062 TaxID=461836 RepID=A0A0L0DMN0_THETB|nr:eukaryotic translation initiation factor 3 subunit E [Thecamonas trahens ATCC 50062]KNC53291.1 eukaryotic translation initiation factor 3 subunit E [Thecamonas trahens ATCC 50062]|eukprot:XP_013754553.1 eukaryotic translation initiation factor 3 subunit E [Thecamonas trahens ATCC 50062]
MSHLTTVMAPYLDKHLVLVLLDFLAKQEENQQELDEVRLEIIAKTNMVDYAVSVHEALHPGAAAPEELVASREKVVAELKALKEAAGPLLEVLGDEEALKAMEENGRYSREGMLEVEGVSAETIDALNDYAKCLYECGKYEAAASYLAHYIKLAGDEAKTTAAMWGKLASEILAAADWEAAYDDLLALKDVIDPPTGERGRRRRGDAVTNEAASLKLQQRTWLIHWSLFVFFNHPEGRNGIIDFLLEDAYLNTIQTSCPHILRYLTTAVVTNKRRRNVLKTLVTVIQQESYSYSDPITEFVCSLYVDFDFDLARAKLHACEDVLRSDFFLVACFDDFLANARLFIFETYCRIHQNIDLSMLADKLDMDRDQAEKWIVNLVRNANIDAKIDSAADQVVMGNQQHPSIYSQIIEKTKGLSLRSSVLSNNCDRLVRE